MPYPTHDELLEAEPIPEWLDDHFLRADPFAFQDTGFRPVVRLVSAGLDVDANGIYCIGSGAVGLSLNPSNIIDESLKSFDAGSDIDLAVISEVYFERAWRDLRRATQPVLPETEIAEVVRENISWQKKRLFDGAILAHKLLPELSFGSSWLPATTRISERIATLLDREVTVNLWIYRDYWSLRNYVATGLVKCRRRIPKQ
jgi:hypothetical protein